MNTLTQNLLNQVNEKLRAKPLIYFCKDSERATGLEGLLQNYHVACSDNNYLTQSLGKKVNLFCEQQLNPGTNITSTLELLSSPYLLNWLKNITKDQAFYGQFFQFNNPSVIKLVNLKGSLLNNDVALNRKFEDKLSQYKILSENNIPVPQTIIGNISEFTYTDLATDLGAEIVIQMDRAHTGLGTFFVRNENDWNKTQRSLAGNIVKLSKVIKGAAYTVNGCVTKRGVFVAGLQYQITGIPALTNGEGSTVGNDFSYANELPLQAKQNIFNMVKEVGKLMQNDGFRGLFGIDVVLQDNVNPILIEVNARQTANIALQTRLELKADVTPLSLINLAEFLDITIEENPPIEIIPLEGSQVFLRAKTDNFIVNHSLKSGIYRLQSDNAAIDWNSLQLKDGVILIDEEGDKPLVWQKDGFNVGEIENNTGGFVLLIQAKGSVRNRTDEIARMQFNNRIVSSAGLSPWITEAFTSIENIIR